jgi:hypothetical protein
MESNNDRRHQHVGSLQGRGGGGLEAGSSDGAKSSGSHHDDKTMSQRQQMVQVPHMGCQGGYVTVRFCRREGSHLRALSTVH